MRISSTWRSVEGGRMRLRLRKIGFKSIAVFGVLVCMMVMAMPAGADQVITIDLNRQPLFDFAGQLQQSYILFTFGGPPRICHLLSPGGSGRVFVSQTFPFLSVNSNNFLIRSRHLIAAAALDEEGGEEAESGVCVAVLDAATDFLFRSDAEGLFGLRRSPERMSDIAAVIEDLRDQFGDNLLVVAWGQSRGTIDMMAAATQLDVQALVLMSSITRDTGTDPENVFNIDPSLVEQPTLVARHLQDTCPVTPPEDAIVLMQQLVNARRVKLLSVRGGLPPVDTDPCKLLTFHGYLGKEAEVVRKIVKFLDKVLGHRGR